MNIDKAKKVTEIMQKIYYFDNRIQCLSSKYQDNFSIYYDEFQEFELSINDVQFLLNHYKEERERLETELQKL